MNKPFFPIPKENRAIAKKVFIALDCDLSDESFYEALLTEIQGQVAGVKIGSAAFTLLGPPLVEKAKSQKVPVFLDLKFHDIPNTVALAARSAVRLGVDMFTLHTAGGHKMIDACRQAVDQETSASGKPTKILGITVLTSQKTTTEEVLKCAKLAQNHGCDGVVASAWEVEALRKELGPDFLLVTPGIRLVKKSQNTSSNRSLKDEPGVDDQERVATPEEALQWGADYLVMGRPVLGIAPLIPWVQGKIRH